MRRTIARVATAAVFLLALLTAPARVGANPTTCYEAQYECEVWQWGRMVVTAYLCSDTLLLHYNCEALGGGMLFSGECDTTYSC